MDNMNKIDKYGDYYVLSTYNEVVNGPESQSLETVLEKKIEHGNVQEQYVKHVCRIVREIRERTD